MTAVARDKRWLDDHLPAPRAHEPARLGRALG